MPRQDGPTALLCHEIVNLTSRTSNNYRIGDLCLLIDSGVKPARIANKQGAAQPSTRSDAFHLFVANDFLHVGQVWRVPVPTMFTFGVRTVSRPRIARVTHLISS
ncbi:predicted protein [Botrytis cinerea T4]|uniref:Uncharacterized protein n=1 Tax=Botryotinia fuckeliana (strain T4) TaxID=999810 RepID=G2YMB1_BOTF4|nr:predicted protein [Botrytis cinerea T4]